MQFNYPAVFRQEIRQQRRVPQEVSTANFGLIGFTTKGPVGEAIITRDPVEFFRLFGEYTPKSTTPIIAAAYYANQGQNLVMVRELGANAKASTGEFVTKEDSEVIGLTSDSAPVSLDVSLATLFDIKPGSLKVFAADTVDVVAAAVVGQTTGGNVGPYTFKVPGNRYIVPGSLTLTYTDTVPASVDVTDDGSGAMSGVGGESGTIDYINGSITVTDLVNPGDGTDVTVVYQYIDAKAVNNEIGATPLAGATVYHGQLANKFPYYLSIKFSWTSNSVNYTASVTSAGVIEEDVSGDPIGNIDLVTGEYNIEIASTGLDTGTFLTVDYAQLLFVSAEDDGAGNVTGPLLTGAGTIDYDLGDLVIEVAQTFTDALTIYVSYESVVHSFSALNAGQFGDNLQVQLIRDDNSINVTNGKYEKFTVQVLEDDGGTVTLVDSFTSVKLEGIAESTHIGQVVNDRFTGSSSIKMNSPLTSVVPTGLNGEKKTNVLVRNPDGVANPALVTRLPLSGGEIVPGTLQVVYLGVDGETYTLKDDGQGSFNQDETLDAGIDLTTLATVDYETGEISLVPSSTPAAALDVFAEYVVTGPSIVLTESAQGGYDGDPLTTADIVDQTLAVDNRGVFAFNNFDDLLHIAVPDFAGNPTMQQGLASYLGNRGDSVGLITTPEGLTPKKAAQYKRFVLGLDGQNGERLAMYWPWIDVEDPISQRTIAIPPLGHAAAVISRTDSNRSVGKSPAGTNDGGISFLRGLQYNLQSREVPTLHEAGINAIWAPPRQQNTVMGARTLDTTGGEYTYLAKRRTIDFVSLSVFRSLWWAVHEDIGPELFSSMRNQVVGMLTTFYNRRIIAGNSLKESFFVICDESNNPQETQEQGLVFLDYGVKTQTPAEFVVLRHRQIVG